MKVIKVKCGKEVMKMNKVKKLSCYVLERDKYVLIKTNIRGKI